MEINHKYSRLKIIKKLYSFFLIIQLINLYSSHNNNYIIKNIKFNDQKTSVIVNIQYDKSKKFSINDYDLLNIKKNSQITLIENLTFELNLKCDKILHFTIRDSDKKRSEPEYYLNENMDSE